MLRKMVGTIAILASVWGVACSSDDDAGGSAGSGAGAASGSGGSAANAGSIGSGGTGAGSGGSAGSSTGGAATDGGSDASAGAGGAVVGSPELFTESVLELDFTQGQNGRYRAGGGSWQDFESWSQAGNNGNWGNAGVNVQTTDDVRTELVDSVLGSGRLLRTWIEAGDHWKSNATYPRTELTSSHTANVEFDSEWRLEIPFYVSGDVATTGSSIAGFQFHHNGNSGSPPFALGIKDGTLGFWIEEAPSGPNEYTPIFALQENTLIDLVFEVKFGYATDGAYVRLWANGTKYIDITDKNVGYPDLESTAGYWKFCSLYDWANEVKVSRSVHCGPVVKFFRRP